MQLRGTGSQTMQADIAVLPLIINERKNQPPAVQMHKAGGWFYKS